MIFRITYEPFLPTHWTIDRLYALIIVAPISHPQQ
jgi:hypothetical protein